MKYKTSELEGAALDAALAKANGWENQALDGVAYWWDIDAKAEWWRSDALNAQMRVEWFSPSTDWSEGGPIIERERIMIHPSAYATTWGSFIERKENWSDYLKQVGPTPLIAAMRVYVASKIGEEVDLP